jgi:hypothetical protein
MIPWTISKLPACPVNKKDTYSPSYKLIDKGKGYIVYCKGKNHLNINVPEDYPRYDSRKGFIEIKRGIPVKIEK